MPPKYRFQANLAGARASIGAIASTNDATPMTAVALASIGISRASASLSRVSATVRSDGSSTYSVSGLVHGDVEGIPLLPKAWLFALISMLAGMGILSAANSALLRLAGLANAAAIGGEPVTSLIARSHVIRSLTF